MGRFGRRFPIRPRVIRPVMAVVAVTGAVPVATWANPTGSYTATPVSTLGHSVAGVPLTGDQIAVRMHTYDVDTSSEVPHYFTTGAGFVTKTTDEPASANFTAHIDAPPRLTRRLNVGEATSESALGEMALNNMESDLDDLLTQPSEGRAATVWQGPDGGDIAADYAVVWEGAVETVAGDEDQLRVKFADQLTLLDQKIQPNKYAGDNDLPDGLEGTEEDVKGKPKVRCIGTVWMPTLPCVNTARWIFHVNDGPVDDVPIVMDARIRLVQGTDYTDQAEMESLAGLPAAGYYRVLNTVGGTWIRLGTDPLGPVTAVISQVDPASGDSTIGGLVSTLLIEAGVDPLMIAGDDIDALKAVELARTGIYWVLGDFIDAETTYRDVLVRLCKSRGVILYLDANQFWRLQEWDAPSGAPAFTLTADQIEPGSAQLIAPASAEESNPVFRVNLHHLKNFTVQTQGIPADADPLDRAFAAEEYRTVFAEDLSVKDAYPLAREIDIHTLIVDHDEAQAECNRQLALQKAKRNTYRVTAMGLTADQTAAIDLMAVGAITYPKYGFAGGALVRVVGIDRTEDVDSRVLEVWK